jgi:threonine aldolase
VFVMKGTIAQMAALRVWTDRSGVATVALHPKSHIDFDEQRAYELLHRLIPLRIGGHSPFRVEDLQGIRERIGAVVVELPLRRAGYRLPSWDELVAISDWCRAHALPLHFDGARLWESAPFYARPLAEIAALADSVYVSFYKGLGALAGCVLCGPSDFIEDVRLWQTRHGGNLFTAFPYVIAADEGLNRHLPQMERYHARACQLAAELAHLPGIRIAPDPPHTNAFQVYLPGNEARLEQAVLEIAEAERVWLFNVVSDSPLPNLSMAEITIGEAADDLADDEIARLLGSLVDRARAG